MNRPDKPEQDELLKQYLTGQDRVSATYAEQAREEPARQLDAAVLQAARVALEDAAPLNAGNKAAGSARKPARYLPMAASVMLGVLAGSWYLSQGPETVISNQGVPISFELERPAPVVQSAERAVMDATATNSAEAISVAPTEQLQAVAPTAGLAPAAARSSLAKADQSLQQDSDSSELQEPLAASRVTNATAGITSTQVNVDSENQPDQGAIAIDSRPAQSSQDSSNTVDVVAAQRNDWISRIRQLEVALAGQVQPDAELSATLAEEKRLFRLAWPELDLEVELATQAP